MKKNPNLTGAPALIIVFTFAIYFNALFNGFVDDDHTAIVENPWLRDFSNVFAVFKSSVWGFEEGREASNYFRPFYTLTNTIEFHLFGLNPMGWHFFNVALHALNSILVFFVAWRLVGHALLALFAGLVFAGHPIHTEAAAWASPIGELTFSFFFLSSFLLYLKARDENALRWHALSVLAFFLGTLCKETILTLLVLLPLYDVLKSGPGASIRSIKHYVFYWGAAAVYFLMRVRAFGKVVPREAMHPYLSEFQNGLNAVALVAKYLLALVLPINLSSFHPFEPVYGVFEIKFVASLLAVVVVFFVLMRLRGKDYLYAFSLVWVVAPLLVVLYAPVLDRNTYAERYIYLPVTGFALLLATAGKRYIGHRAERTRHVIIAFMALLAVYSIGTIKRNFEWKDDFTLWKATIKKDPDNYFILERLGRMYFERGGVDDAIALLERSAASNEARRNPDPRVLMFAYMGLGDLYMTKKMPVEALDRYDRARELAPMRHDINIRIGRFHHAQGNLPLAIEFYAASLNGAESGREATASLNALGNAYLESADLEMAERSFLQALRLSPDDRAAKAGLLSAKR